MRNFRILMILNVCWCSISCTDIGLMACVLQLSREIYLCVHNYQNSFGYTVNPMIIYFLLICEKEGNLNGKKRLETAFCVIFLQAWTSFQHKKYSLLQNSSTLNWSLRSGVLISQFLVSIHRSEQIKYKYCKSFAPCNIKNNI